MDLDRLERVLWFLSALGLAMVVVGLVGEVRGWWNDVGELLVSFGTVVTVATGVIALFINATKEQVRQVALGVAQNGATLEEMREGHGGKLDRIYVDHGRKLDRIYEDHGEKLDRIHDDLGALHEDVSDGFESVNRNLENNHDVLVQIRDRL